MTIKFDPKRPFTAIFGDHGGARVGQDGHYFNGAYEHLPELDRKPASASPEPQPEPAPVPEPEPESGDAVPRPEPDLQMGDPEVRNVDVKAWARGEIKVQWHILADAVQAIYSERPRNGDHARQIIAQG